MKAIVLSGGGARGAYQVGVLKAISDILSEHRLQNPFQILCGVSAGAINAAALASHLDDFPLAAQKLTDLWGHLESEQVFRTDAVSLGRIGLQWMGELSFGGLTGGAPGRALLDTSPLGDLIRNNLDFGGIQKNIAAGVMKALTITALDYRSSETVTFVQGDPALPDWKKTRRHSEKAVIQAEHVLASSAIPILFLPGQVQDRWFGDGCVRNATPLQPALQLGADRIFVIGVRRHQEYMGVSSPPSGRGPSVGRIINVLMNSILLDGIEVDHERMERINEFVRRVPEPYRDQLNFREVKSLFIHPSEDIGALAAQMSSKLPRIVRYLLKGLGPLEEASELVSYLLFEKEFTTRLIEMGYRDGMNSREEIIAFVQAP
jgi:NTE family protein